MYYLLAVVASSTSPVCPVLENTHRAGQKVALPATTPRTAFLFAHQRCSITHTHSCETRLIHARQQVPCIHDTSVLLLNNCVQHDVNDHSLDEPRLPS